MLRRLGADSFGEGLGHRQRIIEKKLLELARARRALRAPRIDVAALQQRWPDLTWTERRRAVRGLVDCVVIERGAEPLIERTSIFKRGSGPLILGRGGKVELSDAARRRASRPPGHTAWSPQRIEQELHRFLQGRTQWPDYADFADAGFARLHAQVGAWGGPYYWGHRLGIAVPNRFLRWNDARLRSALLPLLEGRTDWPKKAEFDAIGLGPVHGALRSRGGTHYWAEQFGLAHRAHGLEQWPRQRVEREITDFAAGFDMFPSKNQFLLAGKGRLYNAVLRNGGMFYWAAQLDMKVPAGGLDRKRA